MASARVFAELQLSYGQGVHKFLQECKT